MKLIILAAGEGTRLRPYTLEKPKCMVEYKGKAIIDHILGACDKEGIKDLSIVSGYKESVLKEHLKGRNIKFYKNERFNSTNMLSSLFCAEPEMNDDIIISYADIIYKDEILRKIKQSTAPFSVVIDKDWFKLWSVRMEDPMSDAETLKLDTNGNIKELGKKPGSLSDIEGQYIGLLKISKEAIPRVKEFYHSLDKNAIYDGKNFDNMFMTSFIQLIIDRLMPIKPVFIEGGWMEIDSVQDLQAYEKHGTWIKQ